MKIPTVAVLLIVVASGSNAQQNFKDCSDALQDLSGCGAITVRDALQKFEYDLRSEAGGNTARYSPALSSIV